MDSFCSAEKTRTSSHQWYLFWASSFNPGDLYYLGYKNNNNNNYTSKPLCDTVLKIGQQVGKAASRILVVFWLNIVYATFFSTWRTPAERESKQDGH